MMYMGLPVYQQGAASLPEGGCQSISRGLPVYRQEAASLSDKGCQATTKVQLVSEGGRQLVHQKGGVSPPHR